MRILYEDKHGKYKDVPITDIQLTTLMANCAMAIVQYCIVRPKFMRYIKKHTANFEHLYENKHFVATVCSFPIAQQKEAEQVMAYLLLSDSVEYRNFLHANMNRIFIQIVEASEDDDLIYFSNTLPPKVSNLDSVYYAAFCFWYLYVTQENPDTGILFDDKEYPMIVLQYLVDRFNYYPNISNGGLDGIKAPHIIDKLAYGSTQRSITVAHPELEDYLNLFRHVISKLCKPSHNYEAVPLSDEMVNMINNQYDYFYNEVSDKDDRIYLLVKNMIAYIAPLIDDFNLLQDRYYKDNAPHEYIADKLSKKLYAADKETAQNALFMYVDNLNMDTIATLLYHKYDKVVL